MTQPSLYDALSFHLISTKPRTEAAKQQRASAFRLWRSLWSPTFEEIGERLHEIDFFASDMVAMMSYRDQPIALSLLNQFDLADDIYPWRNLLPGTGVSKLMEAGHRRVLMGNYFTVDNNWRGPNAPFPAKLALLALLKECLHYTDASMIMGVMRRSRGMTTAGAALGVTPLEIDGPLVVHGEPADILASPKDQVLCMPPPMQALIHDVWARHRTYDLPEASSRARSTDLIAS